MLDDILAMPDHLRDALWRIESAGLRPEPAAGVFVCGMGGSAIGADLAAAALAERVTRPVQTIRGYGLPSWATPEWSVLCSSYSGDTEETIACFAAAEALGARRLVASTGGALTEQARAAGVPVVGLPGTLQPRTAVAYMFAIAAEAAALAEAAPSIHIEIDAATAHLESSRESLQKLAAEIAGRVEGSVPVIHGAGVTAPVARRRKTQVNEVAKLPAFFTELPEGDHNELEGWDGAQASGARFSAVFLEDADQHPRERRRFELTADAIADDVEELVTVETEGDTATARQLWAVMLGDLVSLRLAEARGVDPVPVEALETLKDELGRP
ncbi:MAG: bifunctional phosphoglucose/phosphomannose isomerase [Solirubrobacterales bacterium]